MYLAVRGTREHVLAPESGREVDMRKNAPLTCRGIGFASTNFWDFFRELF
jgi:hypothetical protein